MPIAAHLTYRPKGAEDRLQIRDIHLEYMIANRDLVSAGGAVKEGEQVVGMYLLFRTDDRKSVSDFLNGEPYSKSGLFSDVRIIEFDQFIPEPREGFLSDMLEKSREFIRNPIGSCKS